MMKEYKEIYKDTFDEINPATDLEKRVRDRKFTHKRIKNGWVAAIIMLIIVGTATGIEAAMSHFSFLSVFSQKEESGYQIKIDTDRINMNDLNGQISEIEDAVKKQIQNHKSFSDEDPCRYMKYFDSIEECMKYIGLNEEYYVIENTTPATLNVQCDKNGDILSIRVETDYTINGDNVQLWYYIFSEKEDSESIFESVVNGKADYKIEDKTLKDGTLIPIIMSGSNVETYFSKGHVTYAINVINEDGDTEAAKKTMDMAVGGFKCENGYN